MKSPLNLVEMLSIVLYTEASCNYDLCKAQRSGDYQKWITFDYVLDKAIQKLSKAEYAKYPCYSGIGNVMMDFEKKYHDQTTVIQYCLGYLCTFTSTSWDINVAKKFCGSTGMIAAFESDLRQFGCDVSWISFFGDSEREILFTRGNLWRNLNLF